MERKREEGWQGVGESRGRREREKWRERIGKREKERWEERFREKVKGNGRIKRR